MNQVMNYIKGAFRFGHLNNPLLGDSAHFHVYHLMQNQESSAFRLELDVRFSTDADGIAESLGLQTSHKMELETINKLLAAKMSDKTLFLLG